jgi:hypothetical protein
MRPAAALFILDVPTGKVISARDLPNKLEAYSTPVIHEGYGVLLSLTTKPNDNQAP